MDGHLKVLFSSGYMVRLTLLTWVCYAADYCVVIAVVGVPGVLLGTALIEVPRIGRRWAMVGSSALMGASLFLCAMITTPAASVRFNAMELLFQSMFNAILYGWTPEDHNQLSLPEN
ncbi:uncharacterized protein PHACADRAFT_196291 [Phanerochaete carnosa HHB-10118-sp]|uniref:Major facilitator superfamily (MFS) profile domain-containing protein n=1 Tax=Phanerochaete carnosa (strain HHB-10118-sp) TaxID=650164 RepID=K5X0E1_PHACS|nr:uncharacterized protein PHACADRAFT_196291 [Phanerochaete carnosa HHB-10118-sp]EKM56232.1 hypothetical protein PHACADRAFT_196291 [Phanerochaete carnosa HHB-10118-sp]